MKRYVKITLIRAVMYYGSGILTLKLAAQFIKKCFSISMHYKQVAYLLSCFGLSIHDIKSQEQRGFWRDVFDDVLNYGVY